MLFTDWKFVDKIIHTTNMLQYFYVLFTVLLKIIYFRFMICCDICLDWFHGKCVGITKSKGKVRWKNDAIFFLAFSVLFVQIRFLIWFGYNQVRRSGSRVTKNSHHEIRRRKKISWFSIVWCSLWSDEDFFYSFYALKKLKWRNFTFSRAGCSTLKRWRLILGFYVPLWGLSIPYPGIKQISTRSFDISVRT